MDPDLQHGSFGDREVALKHSGSFVGERGAIVDVTILLGLSLPTITAGSVYYVHLRREAVVGKQAKAQTTPPSDIAYMQPFHRPAAAVY